MKKSLSIIAALAAIVGCTGGKNYNISGEIPVEIGIESVYLINANTGSVIDSADVVNGEFLLKGAMPQDCNIAYVLDKADTKLAQVGASLYLEPGNIKIISDQDMGLIAVGSPSNDAQVDFIKTTNEIEEEDEFMEALRNSVKSNIGNPFGLDQLATALMYNALSADEAEDLYNKFPESMKESVAAEQIEQQIEVQKKIGVGKPYIDFALADMITGEPRSLKSVVETEGNKYVLLDFWASWCGPCMGEVPYLVEVYGKYHEKGFEIFGCSLDRDGDSWKMAAMTKEMNWIHVSDLKYWECEGAAEYGVRSIPANYLIDCATGEIVATNLRGEKLGETIAKLLD